MKIHKPDFEPRPAAPAPETDPISNPLYVAGAVAGMALAGGLVGLFGAVAYWTFRGLTGV